MKANQRSRAAMHFIRRMRQLGRVPDQSSYAEGVAHSLRPSNRWRATSLQLSAQAMKKA